MSHICRPCWLPPLSAALRRCGRWKVPTCAALSRCPVLTNVGLIFSILGSKWVGIFEHILGTTPETHDFGNVPRNEVFRLLKPWVSTVKRSNFGWFMATSILRDPYKGLETCSVVWLMSGTCFSSGDCRLELTYIFQSNVINPTSLTPLKVHKGPNSPMIYQNVCVVVHSLIRKFKYCRSMRSMRHAHGVSRLWNIYIYLHMYWIGISIIIDRYIYIFTWVDNPHQKLQGGVRLTPKSSAHRWEW